MNNEKAIRIFVMGEGGESTQTIKEATWLDVLEEMVHLFIKILRVQEKDTPKEEKLQVYRDVIKFLRMYAVPFCNGLVVRMVKRGELERTWWALNVLSMCEKLRDVLTERVKDCRGLYGEEFEECIGFNAILVLDHFKYILHTNPIGRWNLVITFPITRTPRPEEELKPLIKIVIKEGTVPAGYEDLLNSTEEVFDIITALNHDPYLALDQAWRLREKMKDPRFSWYRLY